MLKNNIWPKWAVDKIVNMMERNERMWLGAEGELRNVGVGGAGGTCEEPVGSGLALQPSRCSSLSPALKPLSCHSGGPWCPCWSRACCWINMFGLKQHCPHTVKVDVSCDSVCEPLEVLTMWPSLWPQNSRSTSGVPPATISWPSWWAQAASGQGRGPGSDQTCRVGEGLWSCRLLWCQHTANSVFYGHKWSVNTEHSCRKLSLKSGS